MIWIAPTEKDTATETLEKRLWDAADQFRANSGLKAQEYSAPVLGLFFLRFAEVRFAAKRAQLKSPSPLGGERAGVRGSGHPRPSDGRGAGGEGTPHVSRRGSRVDEAAAYHAEGILYLPAEARFDYLLNRPEAENIGAKVNAAMRDIENAPGEGTGPTISEIPASLDYDDPHDATGRFDFVLANPPFNVNAVDKERLKDMVGTSRRFAFGLPRTDNANHLWIQLFHSALNARPRRIRHGQRHKKRALLLDENDGRSPQMRCRTRQRRRGGAQERHGSEVEGIRGERRGGLREGVTATDYAPPNNRN